jgi:sugar-specific transcriptional regulator TrmB
MTGYEAKVYLALLAAGEPLNGYEVAKASGVPRSTVYETLAKVVDRGAAFEVADKSSGTSYMALPAETLIGRLRRELSDTLEGRAEALPQIGTEPEAFVGQHRHGRHNVMQRAEDIIDGSESELFLSLWPDEVEELRRSLLGAEARGIDISLVSFGELTEPIGHSYTHRFSDPEVVLESVGCQIFTVVADRSVALTGGISGDDVWAMWSNDPAVALLAAEYVRHDIAIQVVGARLDAAGLADLWTGEPELERLRVASALTASLRQRAQR